MCEPAGRWAQGSGDPRAASGLLVDGLRPDMVGFGAVIVLGLVSAW